jgi:hypothetical protein
MALRQDDSASAAHSYIKSFGRLKSVQRVDELIRSIERVLEPDYEQFTTTVLDAGPPEATQSIKYLPFNRQIIHAQDRTTSLSLVAMLNNSRMHKYQLKGMKKKISQKVFALTANLMDVFINNIRIDARLIDIMVNSTGELSILGMLQVDEISRAKLISRRIRCIRPLLLIPGIRNDDLQYVKTFELRNERQRIKRLGLPVYKALTLEEARIYGFACTPDRQNCAEGADGSPTPDHQKEFTHE